MKETGTQITGVDQKEERNIQPEKNEATRIHKNEKRLRSLQDILKRSNIRIIGVPEGEEEEQKIENLFEQIIKENVLNLAKEINRLPGSPILFTISFGGNVRWHSEAFKYNSKLKVISMSSALFLILFLSVILLLSHYCFSLYFLLPNKASTVCIFGHNGYYLTTWSGSKSV